MKEKKKRIAFLDIYRGIGIVIMIAGHIGFGERFDYWLHAFHMPMWFIISGYFYREPERITGYVCKKAKQLLIPYFAFGGGYYVLWLILKRDAPILEPIRHILFFNHTGLPISGVLWFLTCLFLMDLFFLIIKKFFEKDIAVLMTALAIALLGITFNVIIGIRLPWSADTAMINIPFYCIGYLLRKKGTNKYIYRVLHLVPIYTFAILLTGSYLIFKNGYVNLRTAHYGSCGLFYLNAIIMVVGLWNFSQILFDLSTSSKVFKILANELMYIGSHSISYLCTNQVVIMACTMALSFLLREIPIDMKIEVSAFIILALTMCIEKIVSKVLYSPKLRIFIGIAER